MSQTHISAGCLLSVPRLLLLCVTDEKNILEKMESSKGPCIFMRIKYQTAIQASVPSDTEATAKVAKTQLKLRPREKEIKTQACWQHLIDTTVTSITCLGSL